MKSAQEYKQQVLRLVVIFCLYLAGRKQNLLQPLCLQNRQWHYTCELCTIRSFVKLIDNCVFEHSIYEILNFLIIGRIGKQLSIQHVSFQLSKSRNNKTQIGNLDGWQLYIFPLIADKADRSHLKSLACVSVVLCCRCSGQNANERFHLKDTQVIFVKFPMV